MRYQSIAPAARYFVLHHGGFILFNRSVDAPGGVQNCEDFLAAHCGPDKENDSSQGSDGSGRPARRPRKRKTLADQRYSGN